MSTRLLNAGRFAASLLIVFVLLAGCSPKEDSTIPKGDEVEMFAKAQELQKDEKYEDAVRLYRQLVREYADTRQASNSQFMIGYIYANHLKDYEQAKIELNRFLEKFGESADSGLVAGAKFELEFMGKDIDEIPILTDLSNDTSSGEARKEPLEMHGE